MNYLSVGGDGLAMTYIRTAVLDNIQSLNHHRIYIAIKMYSETGPCLVLAKLSNITSNCPI